MKTFLVSFSLLFAHIVQAQSLSRIMDSELPLLSVTREGENNFDSIYALVKKDLMLYLEKKPIVQTDSSDQNHFTDVHNADNSFNTYSFGYPSGGTRGTVNTTIVQWKKSNGTYGVYVLHENMSVGEIHVLPAIGKKLYLLIGFEQAGNNIYNAYAQVAQIKNDYLVLDYPAFYTSSDCLYYADHQNSGTSDCIACIQYCDSCRSMSLTGLDNGDEIGIVDTKGKRQVKITDAKKVIFKFDGSRFVRNEQNN